MTKLLDLTKKHLENYLTAGSLIACVQTSPLPQKKTIFSEGGRVSVHRLVP